MALLFRIAGGSRTQYGACAAGFQRCPDDPGRGRKRRAEQHAAYDQPFSHRRKNNQKGRIFFLRSAIFMFKIGFSRFLRIFAVAFELGLSYGVMVTRQILVLKFQVRILVAQPNGKPAVQQRVFCVFRGRPSRLGRGGFVRSFSEAPGFRFRGGEALDGSVFGADRTVCSVCGAGAFRRLRPCRALRLRGGDALDGSFSGQPVLCAPLAGQTVPCAPFAGRRSFRRLRPCRAAKWRNGGRRVGR